MIQPFRLFFLLCASVIMEWVSVVRPLIGFLSLTMPNVNMATCGKADKMWQELFQKILKSNVKYYRVIGCDFLCSSALRLEKSQNCLF